MRMNKNMSCLQAISTAFITLGIILFAVVLEFKVNNNIPLFAGLFLIIAGIVGYVYSLKDIKDKKWIRRFDGFMKHPR